MFDVYRASRDDAEIARLREEVKQLKEKLLLAASQNYCQMCGNTLDGYVPKPIKEKMNESTPYEPTQSEISSYVSACDGDISDEYAKKRLIEIHERKGK